jgi:tetratricopeptide (TPR) repeat protein
MKCASILCLSAASLLLAHARAASLPDTCKLSDSFSAAVRNHPRADVFDAVGAWFAQSGNLACAVAAFQEAIRLEPHSAEAHFDLGVARVRLHELPEAAGEFRLALENRPGFIEAHNSLGAVLLDMGRNEEAKAEFQKSLDLDPKSVFALDHLAQALEAGHHYAAAISYWKRAISIRPDSEELLLSLGIATYENGDAKESIALL